MLVENGSAKLMGRASQTGTVFLFVVEKLANKIDDFCRISSEFCLIDEKVRELR